MSDLLKGVAKRITDYTMARYCVQPGCSTIVDRGRCEKHAIKDTRPTSTERGYDHLWSLYSQTFRAAHPICGEQHDGTMNPAWSICLQQGRTTAADVVDHIIPMSKGGYKWRPTNHQSLCYRCNSAKGDRT